MIKTHSKRKVAIWESEFTFGKVSSFLLFETTGNSSLKAVSGLHVSSEATSKDIINYSVDSVFLLPSGATSVVFQVPI